MARRPFHEDERVSTLSLWSPRLAVFAAVLVLLTVVLHRVFGMATPLAMNLFMLTFALSAIAILIGLVGLAGIWRRGGQGTGAGIAGILVAALVLAWPLAYLPQVVQRAPLNDVTTDLDDPPAFVFAAANRPAGAQSTDYPGRSASRLQQQLYPDIQPLIIDRPATEVQSLVADAVRRQGLTIVAETEPTRDTPGTIEAVGRTLIIGFRDDVAIRIIGRGNRSKVDVRSASRWGQHDFGTNARRVRTIIRAIIERLQSTVPGQSG